MPRNRYKTCKIILTHLSRKGDTVKPAELERAIKMIAGSHPTHTVKPYLDLMIELKMIKRSGELIKILPMKDDEPRRK